MRRSEVWFINLDPTVGAEIKKTRPAVIANDDAIGILPLKVIVPITEWKDRYAVGPWMVRLEPDAENGLDISLRQQMLFRYAPWHKKGLSGGWAKSPVQRCKKSPKHWQLC